MMKYGFVYIWRDRKHNRYYIGSHWGTENDGACYKTPDGRTYTLWWLGSGEAWKMTSQTWIKDKLFWEKHFRNLGIGKDRLMCIVRNV